MKWFWGILCASIIVVAIHCTTLGHYPRIWYDEVLIQEYARNTVFAPNPEWSVHLVETSGDQLIAGGPYLHYIAGSIQELLYRWSGTYLAHRFFFLVSLLTATLGLFLWLRSKRFAPHIAGITALIFLVDTNVIFCIHRYRPELWTMTCVFLGMTALAWAKERSTRTQWWVGCLTGAIMVFVVFFWFAAILFAPLILLEVWETTPTHDKRLTAFGTRFVALCTGSAIVVALCLIPLYDRLPEVAHQLITRCQTEDVEQLGLVGRVRMYFQLSLRSGLVWFGAWIGLGLCLCRREYQRRGHVYLFIGLSLLIIATRVYHLRMAYLMPFLFLFLAQALATCTTARHKAIRSLATLYCGGTLCLYTLVSVIGLNYATYPRTNTYTALTERLATTLPAGSKVYLCDTEHEYYYAARDLGWKPYAHEPHALLYAPERSANLIDKLDAVLFIKELRPTPNQQRFLEQHGYHRAYTVEMPTDPLNPIERLLCRLFYGFRYSSCEIWTRN